MEAILSHQIAAALALLDHPILPQEFDAPDATVRALAERVRVTHDPALDADYPARWPHKISVTMRNGERVLLLSDQPPAADRAQVRAKFRALAAPVLGAANTEEIISAIDDLERIPDLQPLLRLLRCEFAKAA